MISIDLQLRGGRSAKFSLKQNGKKESIHSGYAAPET
jgi:hypothetical protein